VKESLQEEELSSGNCGVAVVGIDEPFVVLDPKTLQAYIEALDSGKDEMQTVEETGTDDRQSSQVPQEGTGSRGISVGASEDTPTDMET
jgi:20S proteasome subunit alpha 6